MKMTTNHRSTLFAGGFALAVAGGGVAHAQDIIDAWKTIPVPAAPAVEPVSVNHADTALLVLDMYATSCNAEQRPSCVPTIPRIKALLADARAHQMKVIYSAGPPAANGPSEPTPELARLPAEPTVRGPADKFFGSDLEKILTDGGIKTVILVGTSADGAILYTGSSASFRNLKVIVPVDGVSSANRFAELYAVWHLKNTTATVSRNVTLTKTGLISIK